MTIAVLGFLLATLVGVSLGLIGAGGSILTFPILVYCFDIRPIDATAYSLFIVGFTSLLGFYAYAKERLVDYKVAFLFGLPSILAVYGVRRYVVPALPEYIGWGAYVISKDLLIMLLFSVLMLMASLSLIRDKKRLLPQSENAKHPQSFSRIFTIFVYGFGVGIATGIVGAGGGFLVMPSLILLARLPIKTAVGTCLLILATKSLIGFTGDFQHNSFDWTFIFSFCAFTALGIFSGTYLSKKIGTQRLKYSFGYFELAVSIVIIFKEIILKPF